MNVFALASYPIEAAATRYRLQQFVAPLAERGINLTIHPFLNSKLFEHLYRRNALPRTAVGLAKSAVLRLGDVLAANKADVIMVQREAMLFGPPVIEWLTARAFKRPMLLDLDDATYVSYTSPTYGRIGRALKWFSKTDDLIRWAKIVTCGNRTIAEYVTSKGATSRIIPTVVDTDLFRPVPHSDDGPLVVGWIGTHSTFSYLESILPVLQELAKTHPFRLKIVGAGREEVKVPGIEVENLEWQLAREISDFQSFDIGLYPIDNRLYADQWASGKSGFKAIQYMAVGIPYVATPVGAAAEIGEVGTTHLTAESEIEWKNALQILLLDPERRQRMGRAGRKYVTNHFGLQDQADKLASALSEVAGSRNADS
jgi:glycosyltransferase involved in cell wall biosynthesis